MQVLNSPRHGVLAIREWTGPVVRGRSWIFRLFDTNSIVPSVAQVVQQSKRRRELIGFMIVVCLKMEAVDDGPRWGATLVMHRAMKGAVVGVWRWREWAMVCVMGQGDGLSTTKRAFSGRPFCPSFGWLWN